MCAFCRRRRQKTKCRHEPIIGGPRACFWGYQMINFRFALVTSLLSVDHEPFMEIIKWLICDSPRENARDLDRPTSNTDRSKRHIVFLRRVLCALQEIVRWISPASSTHRQHLESWRWRSLPLPLQLFSNPHSFDWMEALKDLSGSRARVFDLMWDSHLRRVLSIVESRGVLLSFRVWRPKHRSLPRAQLL